MHELKPGCRKQSLLPAKPCDIISGSGSNINSIEGESFFYNKWSNGNARIVAKYIGATQQSVTIVGTQSFVNIGETKLPRGSDLSPGKS